MFRVLFLAAIALLSQSLLCGRFNLRNPKDIVARFGFMDWSDKRIEPRFNIAPSQEILTIVQLPLDPSPTVQTAVWGLKASGLNRSLINVRAESLANSALVRGARRCLIPASGFYEWRNRQPMHIRRKDDRPFAFAGLWLPDTTTPSAAILTTKPNELMATIHNRMPAILRPEDEVRWLDPNTDPKQVLEPIDSNELEAYPVKPLVNSWENEGAELITPAEPMPEQLELLQ
jgi:putative SOS response-associated peptidase YedK